MPSGGARPGAGRPKGSVAKKHQVTVADVGHPEYLPLEYMLALMRDEKAEASRRDAMAIQAAPFIHAKLNAVSTSNVSGTGGNGGGDVGIVNIFAVPRGARVEKDGTAITIDGTPIELTTITPFEGTPPLSLSDQTEQPVRFDPMAEPCRL